MSKFAKGKGLTKGVILAKADVNGPAETDLFKFLKAKKGGIMGNDIKWNFTKVRERGRGRGGRGGGRMNHKTVMAG